MKQILHGLSVCRQHLDLFFFDVMYQHRLRLFLFFLSDVGDMRLNACKVFSLGVWMPLNPIICKLLYTSYMQLFRGTWTHISVQGKYCNMSMRFPSGRLSVISPFAMLCTFKSCIVVWAELYHLVLSIQHVICFSKSTTQTLIVHTSHFVFSPYQVLCWHDSTQRFKAHCSSPCLMCSHTWMYALVMGVWWSSSPCTEMLSSWLMIVGVEGRIVRRYLYRSQLQWHRTPPALPL